jgi:ABC-type sulfate/molybdate transport systems ATPase subunit
MLILVTTTYRYCLRGLDVLSNELCRLQEALREYKGTVIAVSHDRYFLRQIVNRVVEVADKKLRDYSGDYNVCSLFCHPFPLTFTTVFFQSGLAIDRIFLSISVHSILKPTFLGFVSCSYRGGFSIFF